MAKNETGMKGFDAYEDDEDIASVTGPVYGVYTVEFVDGWRVHEKGVSATKKLVAAYRRDRDDGDGAPPETGEPRERHFPRAPTFWRWRCSNCGRTAIEALETLELIHECPDGLVFRHIQTD